MSVAALTWRLVRRGALAWAAWLAVIFAVGAAAYRGLYTTAEARARFAATFASSRGFDALYGRPDGLDTVAGFVAWRYGTSAVTVVALWTVFATTRVLRGDEEAGRADALLAGPLAPLALLRRQVLTLAAAVGLVAAVGAAACLAVRLPWRDSLVLGGQLLAAGWAFLAVAAVTSQLFTTRRAAAGSAGAVLGAAYLVRAMGDGAPRLGWLAWCSPLGWVERLDAGGRESWLAAALLVTTAAGGLAVAAALRSGRDTGGAALSGREGAGSRRTVTSLLALESVLHRRVVLAWAAGLLVTGLVVGFIAADAARFIADSAELTEQLGGLAGSPVATVAGFLGFSFAIVAVLASLYAGTALVGARHEEEAGRLDSLLTAGASRRRWLGTRLAVSVVGMTVVVLVAGAGAWAGVRLSDQPFPLVDALEGGLNTLPVAVLFLGLATLTFGVVPRAVSAVAFGAVGVTYALLVVGSLGGVPTWLVDLSPFRHLAPVPATGADLTASLVLAGLGALLGAAGVVAFGRRDVAGE